MRCWPEDLARRHVFLCRSNRDEIGAQALLGRAVAPCGLPCEGLDAALAQAVPGCTARELFPGEGALVMTLLAPPGGKRARSGGRGRAFVGRGAHGGDRRLGGGRAAAARRVYGSGRGVRGDGRGRRVGRHDAVARSARGGGGGE